jgi:hypothetical protein
MSVRNGSHAMDNEISPVNDIKLYALGLVCLLAPILISFCLNLGVGGFLAFGSYIVSLQKFVKSTISFLLSASLGRDLCVWLWVIVGLTWFIGGVFSIVVGIASFFMKKWSSRVRIIYICMLAGYLLLFAWIIFNPPVHQIKYALHSKISTGSSPAQVIKVLSSNNINHDDINDKGILVAYIPFDYSVHEHYIITFHFTNNKLSNFMVVLHPDYS